MTQIRTAFKMLWYPRFHCFKPFWAQYSWYDHLVRPHYVIDGIKCYIAFNDDLKNDIEASTPNIYANADVHNLIIFLSMHNVELRREDSFARNTIAHYRSMKACVVTMTPLVVAFIALFVAVCGRG